MWLGTLLTGCLHASKLGLLIDGRVLPLPGLPQVLPLPGPSSSHHPPRPPAQPR